MEPLSVLVFGAGAIGSYVGGSLASKGHHVTFLDRSDTIDKIKLSGIHLRLVNGQRIDLDEPQVSDNLQSVVSQRKFDFSILAIKSFDTDTALMDWIPLSRLIPPVLCLQNGVENESKLANLLGADKVIAGTVTTAIGKQGQAIVVERLRGLGIHQQGNLTEQMYEAFLSADIKPMLFKNADSMKWSKMLTNLVANATSAILGMTPLEILSHPDLYALEIGMLREILAVMKAKKIPVDNLPGTPSRLFAFLVKNIPIPFSQRILKPAMSAGRGAKMPSFYLDLESGRGKSEVEFLNGAVARFGKDSGVPTPINELLTNTLMDIITGKQAREAFYHKPERLLRHLVK
jgi:2-dehydropantoate 2-reductase